MPRSPKLNDLQLILLTTASQREDGSLLPSPDHLGDQAVRVRKFIPPLLRNKLIDEVHVNERSKLWREDGDRLIGLVINDLGRNVIGALDDEQAPRAEDEPPHPGTLNPAEAAQPEATATAPRPGTKAEQVLTMLRRQEGATLNDLVEATGWLPHTTRAALTGVRKKGHEVIKGKRGGETCYSIGAAA
jgi:hypothetical protein